MPPKRPPPSEEPLQASSSSEEDSSEEEDPQIESQKPYSGNPLLLRKPQPESSDSGSETESGSDSEPDNTNVKPIASKHMDGSKPSPSKPSAVVVASPSRTPKRAKKDLDDGVSAEKSVDSTKKQLFQRLFSEDDEIALLKGMLEFAAKKGKDPVVFIELAAKKGKDPVVFIDEFHEFIKKSIHIDVTRAQLMDKIRRLKKKFENNVGKAKKGKDRTFSNAHEQRTYDLSKNIWGRERTSGDEQAVDNGNVVVSSGRVAKDTKNVETEREKNARVESRGGQAVMIEESVRGAGLEGYVLNKGLDLVEGEKKVEMEKKWRILQVAELELFARRAELISEQAKLVLEAYKSMNT
ncbi:mediator-associated protein 1-like isoform X2 [Tripterygium wilfordii]|uniref:Mediator-associated protein 1-like isoform X2 n=1 Tax=Tripterygium wilfordii TaxID=458696 RepID=A0A7J7C2B0_TRIWF|nr:probable transcription factor At4g01260 [Tripterygium wilfordii]KAF5728248.1 mediator-associated protein 1-like isoform X2 [Tripterygium wilfordii]